MHPPSPPLPAWLFRRRDCELWEAAPGGRAFFMVAGRLSRQEALAAAAGLAAARPRSRLLVLDGRGAPVYRSAPGAAGGPAGRWPPAAAARGGT